MNPRTVPTPTSLGSWLLSVSPWLNLLGAAQALVLICLHSAIGSELGHQISTGESPAFSWIGTYINELLFVGLIYLLTGSSLQFIAFRLTGHRYSGAMKVSVGCQVVALGVLVMAISFKWPGTLSWGHATLQASLLFQIFLTLQCSDITKGSEFQAVLHRQANRPLPFLALLFITGAVPGYIDPSWLRLRNYVHLDSTVDAFVSRLLPPVISGITALWFGLGILTILAGIRVLSNMIGKVSSERRLIGVLPFLVVSGLFAGVFLASLSSAIPWELSNLQLRGAILPLFIILTGSGGALTYGTWCRLGPWVPPVREMGLIEMVSLSAGALLVFPLTWLLTRVGSGRRCWRLLLASSLVGGILVGAYILYADIFDPWFTAFSYLKGVALKVSAVVVAGILSLILNEFFSVSSRLALYGKAQWTFVALVVSVSFIPFATLEQYRESKVAILQYNELSRVDAVIAREFFTYLGLDAWIRLGQDPDIDTRREPWPLPWRLQKTGPSLLPQDFNLLVIIVDALRGDAFHSAGYPRNLTPFLDEWARRETVSFLHAYSQGGGSFSALPFLVAGRSQFTLYGPNLHKENLYFKLAQAEGIGRFMLVKDIGPRAIFPSDSPIVELGGARADGVRRSASANEVFGWAQDAIGKLEDGERFLCFLHLMDVHNDLWKKEDGVDFGYTPRDLYDNNLSFLDSTFERFIDWLKQRKMYERTVILFTSDHGEQFWEHGASLHGHTLYEEEIRIPVILLAHGIRARIEDVPVIAADMVPTLLELAGYSLQPPYDDAHMGISLVPLLMGREWERYRNRDVVGRASFKRRYFLYRDWRWKLVYFAELDLLQLFNTAEDPGEKKNLLEERPELAAELERELLGYLNRVEGKHYRPLLSDSLESQQ
ncbi:MAG: sulfatase-like hydrolase/transferase [Deltaproteobacteria bacterium]|nr:MAG: sulfatase-like hydrolase/transferase [Deltaproteobacteria bacterium]